MNIYHPFPDYEKYDRFYPINLTKGIEQIDRFLNLGKYQDVEEQQEWEVLAVNMTTTNNKKGDFSGITAHNIICNSKALDTLSPLIENSVKLFPVQYKKDMLWLIKVIDIVDCLDYSKADVFRFEEDGKVLGINKYAFTENIIQNKHFFSLPELKFDILVSQDFKDCVEQNQLEGLLFKQVA